MFVINSVFNGWTALALSAAYNLAWGVAIFVVGLSLKYLLSRGARREGEDTWRKAPSGGALRRRTGGRDGADAAPARSRLPGRPAPGRPPALGRPSAKSLRTRRSAVTDFWLRSLRVEGGPFPHPGGEQRSGLQRERKLGATDVDEHAV